MPELQQQDLLLYAPWMYQCLSLVPFIYMPRYVLSQDGMQVPRMHAITAVKLKGTEDLPLIAYKGSKERQAQVAELRATALSFLQTALGGDRLAAEYLLLQMVSRYVFRVTLNRIYPSVDDRRVFKQMKHKTIVQDDKRIWE